MSGTVTLGLLEALYALRTFRLHGAVVGFVLDSCWHTLRPFSPRNSKNRGLEKKFVTKLPVRNVWNANISPHGFEFFANNKIRRNPRIFCIDSIIIGMKPGTTGCTPVNSKACSCCMFRLIEMCCVLLTAHLSHSEYVVMALSIPYGMHMDHLHEQVAAGGVLWVHHRPVLAFGKKSLRIKFSLDCSQGLACSVWRDTRQWVIFT